MTKFLFSALAVFTLGAPSLAQAAPVDAVSFLQMDYRFVSVATDPVPGPLVVGASPAGMSVSTGGPAFNISIGSQIEDPGAVTAIDQNTVQVGCASCEPLVPFVSTRRLRVNRADPTEFADAQANIENTISQDQGADVTSFAIGQQQTDRDGLAQLRITSSPAAAEAGSTYGISRVTTYENTSDAQLALQFVTEIDVDLLARYSGEDGFARASTTQSVLFSGVSDGNLTTVVTEDTSQVTEIGDGASVTADTFHSGSGIMGLLFSASATALGDGGFTEASFSLFHRVVFLLFIDPGQAVQMETAFSQANFVEYAPGPVSEIPLPAGALLLCSGLALLTGRRAFQVLLIHTKHG